MTAPYSGAWRRSVMAYTDQGVEVHTADPSHQTTGEHTGSSGNWQATPAGAQDVAALEPDLSNYPGMMYVLSPDGSHPVDQTPADDHGNGYGAHADATEADYAQRRLAAHSVDQGAPAREYSEPKPLQFSDEHYRSITAESLGAPDDGAVGTGGLVAALQRGLNAFAINNPQGFRRGTATINPVDREFWGVGQRELEHTHRPLSPNLAYARRQDIPADDGEYGWAFNQGELFNSVEVPTPYVRDDAPSFDTAVTTTPTAPSPVVGAGTWF